MQILIDVCADDYTSPPAHTDEIPSTATFLTIGNFDGLHLGHQTLFTQLQQAAERYQQTHHASAVQTGFLTFQPHPLAILRPQNAVKLLTTPYERLTLARQQEIDIGILQSFNPDIAKLSPQTFIGRLKARVGLAGLVVGPDFALGRGRTGDIERLRQLSHALDFELHVIDPVQLGGQEVRSSTIRELVMQGDVNSTTEMLGRPYHITGVVIEGDKRGRQIGVPTANLSVPDEKLLPADGVYATRTWIVPTEMGLQQPAQSGVLVTDLAAQGMTPWHSVTNIGMRPTVGGLDHRIETHLLDFPGTTDTSCGLPLGNNDADIVMPLAGQTDPIVGNIYGRVLVVEFIERLRDEMRFNGLEALVAQIQADIETARTILS
ncbi:MAG: bifunctional riboflavin kinase/FMN adenylyltransferase [Chloroflexota bacterium]